MVHIMIYYILKAVMAVYRKVDGISFVELRENEKLKHLNPLFQISGTEKFTVGKNINIYGTQLIRNR
jgi:hypothetical protein